MRAAEQASATLKASGPSIFGPFTVAGMRPAYGGTVRIQTERLTPPIARIFQPASGVRRFLRLISTTLREGHSPPARRTRSWMNKTKSGSSPESRRCTLFGLGTRSVRLDQISAPRQTRLYRAGSACPLFRLSRPLSTSFVAASPATAWMPTSRLRSNIFSEETTSGSNLTERTVLILRTLLASAHSAWFGGAAR